jgi:osmotically-inducible protein OsmY
MPSPRAVLLAIAVLTAGLWAGCVAADDDAAIAARVKDALVAAQIANAANIEVTAFNGEVDLSGVVYSDRSKAKAAAVAGAVPGVTAVKNDLQVEERPDAKDDDDVIATKVKAALVAAQIPDAEQIDVKTFNGEVDLSGVVSSEEIKAKAASIAGAVPGVTAVRNELQVRDP